MAHKKVASGLSSILTGILLVAGFLNSGLFPLSTVFSDSDSATWEVQSDCTEGSSSLTRKPLAFQGEAGTCTTPSGADKPGLPFSGSGTQLYAYFDVASTYMSGSEYGYARIDVEYFDEAYSSQGDTLFYIQYQSSSDTHTTSIQKAYLNNTQTIPRPTLRPPSILPTSTSSASRVRGLTSAYPS